MSEGLWLAVIFSGDDPAINLGLFDTKEKAVERLLSYCDGDAYETGQGNEISVDIVYGKQKKVVAQAMLMTFNDNVSIEM